MKIKILVSSCLLGERVRYDGIVKKRNESLYKLYKKGFVVPICPEIAGGLAVPRLQSEISVDTNKVINKNGKDVTSYFLKGADVALDLCMKYNIKVAILKSKSPSCSSGLIYDGTFEGKLKKGKGVTSKILELNGISVYDEHQIKKALYFAGIDFKNLLHEQILA